jgi:hypothetical protein
MAATRQSAYCTISDWTILTGMGRATTYDAISRGDLRTKKMGARTLIDVQHGLRWLDSLPQASIRITRAPRREPAAQEVTTP